MLKLKSGSTLQFKTKEQHERLVGARLTEDGKLELEVSIKYIVDPIMCLSEVNLDLYDKVTTGIKNQDGKIKESFVKRW